MATEQQNPISASAAGLEARWPEGSRGRPRAAPESMSPAAPYGAGEFAGAGLAMAPESVATIPSRPSKAERAARVTGGLAGSAVRFVRGMRTRSAAHSDRLEPVRRFVVRHPSALIGAGVAGFLTGRLLQRR